MKSGKSAFLLVLLCLFACQAVVASQTSASLKPYFQYYGVMAYNTHSGLKTLIDVAVVDPDGSVPGTIKSLSVNGPEFHYDFTPSDYLGSGEYWITPSGQLPDGEYVFTMSDTDNNTATTYSYLKVGGIIPLPDETSFQASGADPLAPTLSWSAIPGYPQNLCYRAKILTEAGADVWSASRTFNATSAKVPSGVLQAGVSYCWRVDAFDTASLNNGTTRSSSTCIPLTVKNTHPYFSSVGAFEATNPDGSPGTGFSVQGVDPKGSTCSLVVTDPNGVKHTFSAPPTCFPSNSRCNYYIPGAPPGGLYTFAATNSDNNTAVSYFHLDSYAVPPIDPDTMHASGNPAAPVLSWSAPATIDRPLYYYIQVKDTGTQAIVWSNSTPQSTAVSVPAGKLVSGRSYQWQIVAYDSAEFSVANRSFSLSKSLSVDNDSPYFMYAQLLNRNKADGEYAAFDLSVRDRNGAFPGNLESLTVTWPGGFTYSFQESDYYASDNNFYHDFTGAPEEGLYTFTLTDKDGKSVTTYDYHKRAGGPIPLFDETSFQLYGNPLSPTISWSAIHGYADDVYYRLRIVNQAGTSVFAASSPWWPNTYQTVGTLPAGPTYRYRVEAFDGRYVMTSDNRVGSNYIEFGVPSITGKVTNSEGTGLANISVQAFNAGTGASTPTIPTDANGQYQFSNLPSGSYRISFSGEGYFTEWYNNKTSQPSADLVVVTAPNLTTGIDAILEPSGGISGTVTNEQGVGIQSVYAQVFNPGGNLMGAASTDLNGNYKVSNLATGNYRICYWPPTGYKFECYDNKPNQDLVDYVAVTVPNITTGIDAVLEPGGSISGTLKNAQGAGLPSVQVQVFDMNGMWAAGVQTNSSGQYTANGLGAGQYKVFFKPQTSSGYSSEWYNNKGSRDDADPVTVTVPYITTGIDAVLDQGGSITGTVKTGQGAAISNAQIQVYDADATDTSEPKTATVTTDQAGNFTITGLLTGNYKLFFSAACYYSQWYNNKPDQIAADVVQVTAPNSTAITVVMVPSGCIAGFVKNQAGAGIQNVWVQIFDANGYGLFGTPTNSGGAYAISGLDTGNYKLCFHAPLGYRTECYNNKPSNDTADLVAVTSPYVTTGIDAVLDPGGSISGRVRNGDGAGVANVMVQVFDLNGMWAGGSSTNQNGNYTANGLGAGSYRVYFSPPADTGYTDEWYNSKQNQNEADVVVVTVPNITTDIDAVLERGGSISGTVTDEQGGGIANVQVQVYDAATTDMDSAKSFAVATDDTGSYTVTGLPTGSYRVFFSAVGFYSEWYSNKKSQDAATAVSVTAPNITSGINAVLERSGGISGTVRNESGDGLWNVWVSVFQPDGNYLFGTSTDQSGQYAVSSLPTGSYKLCFYAQQGYRNECYNNKPHQDVGDLVAVVAPNMTTGIDVVLEPGASISGRVTNGEGAGVTNVNVQVYHLNGTWAASGMTNPSGFYSANGLGTGNYKVFFFPNSESGYSSQWYSNKPDMDSADVVSVTVPNTTPDIDAVLNQGGKISGTVKNGSGTGIADVQVYAYDADDSNMNSPRTSANTNGSGNYMLNGLPTGSYKLFFNGVGYFTEWYNDKADQASATPVPVTAPDTTSGINAVLAQSGTITGTVKNASGEALRNVWVNIFGDNDNYIYGVPTDENGNYTASHLGNGNYKVCFNAPCGYRTEWYNNKTTQDAADWVAVTIPKKTTGIDAVLAKGGSISGTVKNTDGSGIPNVGVSAFSLDGKWASGSGTNQSGGYILNGLGAGSYRLLFSPPPDSGYGDEWYNNKASQDSAKAVAVTVPNVTAGIDVVLGGGLITVVSPNGGENWQAGSEQNITWAYTGNIGSFVKIDLLKDGTLVKTIADSAPSGSGGWGSYVWTVPSGQTAATTYKIKVTSKSDASITDTSDANFAVAAVPASITVVTPNGGEEWRAGSDHSINWTFTGSPGNVKITLLKAGKLAATIAGAVSAGKAGQGSFLWSIPQGLTPGKDYKIKVASNTKTSCWDQSDANFSVLTPQPLTVLAPNGGDNWKVGTKYTIRWKYTVDIGPNVKIELLKGEAVAKVIAASAGSGSSGAGSYAWTIPNTTAYGSNYRVRITSTTNNSYTDTSDAVFTISGPTLDVTAPDGGESWRMGTQREILWTYTGSPGGKIKIQLLKGGTAIRTLASGAPIGSGGQGSFSWTVPQDLAVASNYRIKITHTTISGCTGTSGANFSITKGDVASSAGPDQKVTEAEPVKLSGANSTGFDRNTSAFSWKQLDGPEAKLSDPAGVEPGFTAPEAGADGASLLFQLTITGPDGAEAHDRCIVNVANGNLPPVADAGPAQTVVSGWQVQLDGSGSHDPDGALASYSWKQQAGPGVTLSDSASSQPTFAAPECRAEGQTLLFELTVTDQDGLRSRDTCLVNIAGTNLPPKADAGPDQTAAAGSRVVLDGSKSFDPDGDRLSFRWQQLEGPPVTLSEPVAAQPFFVAPVLESDTEALVFQLTVTDGQNLMDKSRVTVQIAVPTPGGGTER